MNSKPPKTASDSSTEQIQIIMPEHINGHKRLFGGKLMEWIDVVAAVVARRHSHLNVTTVCVDHLHFRAAAYVNSTVVLKGRITYTGKTSMEIMVETFVEELTGEQNLINVAYLVMVALDENDKPASVPPLVPQTQEEAALFEAGRQRAIYSKARG